MEAYSEWGQFKTLNLCGATRQDRLYLVEVHTGYSGKGPLGTRPGVLLHNGMTKNDPVLAATGDVSQFAARMYAFNNESIILMPPLSGASRKVEFVTEQMTASVDSAGQVVFRFAIEVNDGKTTRREPFEWRKIEKGTDDAAKEGGFRLVASGRSQPATSGASSSAGADDVVALLMWHKMLSTSGHLFTLQLLGRGASGELGERWTLMVVMTALRLRMIRVHGKTAKGVVAVGQKAQGQ
jgi:hypothetical protein